MSIDPKILVSLLLIFVVIGVFLWGQTGKRRKGKIAKKLADDYVKKEQARVDAVLAEADAKARARVQKAQDAVMKKGLPNVTDRSSVHYPIGPSKPVRKPTRKPNT